MKRYLRLFCGLLVLVLLCCCIRLPINANAQATTENRTVLIKVFVQSGASAVKNKYVDVYFQNIATEEEYVITLKAGTDQTPAELPKGEYRVAKAVLTDQPEVELETSVANLVVDDSENIFYTLSLKSIITTDGNKVEIKNSLNKLQLKELNTFLLAIATLLWLALGGVSLAYTIRSNFKKNAIKRDFLKAKGKITRHLFFGLLFGAVVGMLFGGKDGMSWIGGAIGFGVPFGLPAASMLFAPRDDDYYDDDRRESSGATIVIAMAVATAIGVILVPIVLVCDIVELVKSYRSYKEESSGIMR